MAANISVIDFGRFQLDGGTMFSIIPKSIWGRMVDADEKNLCTWGMRSLLVEEGNRKILIDTGIGRKYTEKFASYYNPDPWDWPITHHVQPQEITDVILTHLHFDHVGGAVVLDQKGNLVPFFENATYWSNTIHYNWASNSNPREAASFIPDNFVPLVNHKCLSFIDVEQGVKFTDSISMWFADGHTKAMMMPLINSNKGPVFFPSDLLPTHAHTKLPYLTSFDIDPLQAIKEKQQLHEWAIGDQWNILLQHDPFHNFGNLRRNEKGNVEMFNLRKDLE